MNNAIARLLTLAALIGVGALLGAVRAPSHAGALAAMFLGFTLLTAYVAGDVAASIRLPRVTGYVLSGILVGPHVLGVLLPETVAELRTIDELALTLIALTAGGELRLRELRGKLTSIVSVSLSVMAIVGVGVFLVVLAARPLIPFLAGRSTGMAVAVAALLGVWCANSSPDATIAVINESRARGPLTETIVGVTILKDVLVIIAFAAVLALARPLSNPDAGGFDVALLTSMLWEVLGALAVGTLAGLVFALYLDRVAARSVLATLAFAFLLTLIAGALHVELLLTAVGAGFATENFSSAGDALLDAVESNALVVFALFFALAGATLDLGALRSYGALALGFVLVRGGLTWLGVRVGARMANTPPAVAGRTWMGLVSQAGVTLGLSLLVAREFPDWGRDFIAFTTAIIIFHLLVGPVLLKLALSRAGESEGARNGTGGVAGSPAPGTSPASMGA